MITCSACQNPKLQMIWQGYARIGKVGNHSNSITKAYKCKKCGTVSSVQSSKYLQENFRTGNYRRSVDGKTASNSDKYFFKYFEETLLHLLHVPKEYLLGKKVLDFGSGGGSFLKLISPFIELGVGIELDKNFHFKNRNIINLSSFSKADKVCKKYDLVTCYSVFGQLLNSSEVIYNLNKRLKKNGILIIADINANDYLLTHGREKYKKEIFFRQSYQNYFTEKGLKILAKNNNLSFISSKYIQRYGYQNIVKYISKVSLNHKVGKNLKEEEVKNYLKRNFELNGESDYMILYFRKKN